MDRDVALAVIRRHEAELRRLGVVRLSLFGSTARGEAGAGSDVDVAVGLDADLTGLRALGCLERAGMLLSLWLNAPVDVVPEPVDAGPLGAAIERDRRVAFA